MAYEQGTGMGIWLQPAKVGPVDWSAPAASGAPGAVAPTFKDPLDLMPAVTGIADTMYQMGKNKAIAKPIGIDELTGATIYEPGPGWEMFGLSPLPAGNNVYKDDLPIYQERFLWNKKKKEKDDLEAKIAQEEKDAEKVAQEDGTVLADAESNWALRDEQEIRDAKREKGQEQLLALLEKANDKTLYPYGPPQELLAQITALQGEVSESGLNLIERYKVWQEKRRNEYLANTKLIVLANGQTQRVPLNYGEGWAASKWDYKQTWADFQAYMDKLTAK